MTATEDGGVSMEHRVAGSAARDDENTAGKPTKYEVAGEKAVDQATELYVATEHANRRMRFERIVRQASVSP